MICDFPKINYSKVVTPLSDGGQPRRVPSGMITLLSGQGSHPEFHFVGSDFARKFDDDINKLENSILEDVCAYRPGADLEQIFHKIQIWGGPMGRMVYVRQKFDWKKIGPKYRVLVDACLNMKDLSESSVDAMYKAMLECRINQLGVSFMTKHVHFWTYSSLGENALPILDKVMSRIFVEGARLGLKAVKPYWLDMIAESRKEKVSLVALERQLFSYCQKNSR